MSNPVAVETDTAIAVALEARARLQSKIEYTQNDIRRTLGQRGFTSRDWTVSLSETMAQAQAKAKEDSGIGRIIARDLAELDDMAAQDKALVVEIAALDEVYQQHGGWSRFYLVTNNNGHIHSNLSCQTCFVSTQYAWLTALSGETEADAVEAHGTRLCSVCFPSAPVEWTLGLPKPAGCAGSGKAPAGEIQRNRRGDRWGECSECGKTQAVTMYGVIRKHKPSA